MPIGKNAIKRVGNNGYSKVKTEAPDMVNSTVIAGTSREVLDMVEREVKKAKTPTKKTVLTPPEVQPEKTPKIASEAKKSPAKKTATKKPSVKKVENKNFEIISFGDEMPIHLL